MTSEQLDARTLAADLQPVPAIDPRTTLVSHEGDDWLMAEWARENFRYPFVEPIRHLRLFSADHSTGAGLIVHSVTDNGDAELLVMSVGLRWTRPTLRYVAAWLFDDLDLRRVTARVRSDDRATRDYCRRLGFRHEGIQRRWFADDVDAVLWGLHRTERKPWL
jgi:hypothetical protein